MPRLPTLAALTFALLPGAAQAAMVGNPVSRPQAGVLELGVAADTRAVVVEVDGCETGSCEAVWRPSQIGARVELSPLRGVGLQGGGSWIAESIPEATYDGQGYSYWGGAELALPVGRDVYLAAVAQLERSATREVSSSSEALIARTVATRALVGTLVAWSPDDDSFALYGGPAFHPLQRHTTTHEELEVELRLRRSAPLLGVLGLELRSAPLGLPWAKNNGRMLLGVEAQIDRGIGGSLWLGAAF
jgi:hypothetical protein